jgi:hypothetical protein
MYRYCSGIRLDELGKTTYILNRNSRVLRLAFEQGTALISYREQLASVNYSLTLNKISTSHSLQIISLE